MLARTRRPDAVKSFESALSMSGDFRYSDSARYLLGITLRELESTTVPLPSFVR